MLLLLLCGYSKVTYPPREGRAAGARKQSKHSSFGTRGFLVFSTCQRRPAYIIYSSSHLVVVFEANPLHSKFNPLFIFS
ncbi:hypothetical protein I7I53_11054 [Histoplasma capsulatum var. duboisii H88]|uniref:Uncharacterized protein n=1 Tax=Ajellomyces capsulatus (strain H88) TaxID=544711 RepID=A0A8A1LEG2_AJEC8|nr:hypothetical protein I7I53_11054 [Histoplasma capsulatum var. duboisii H88]